jgi:cytochrome b561
MSSTPTRRQSSEDVLVRYDPTTIVLHWATACLVVALWGLGQTSDWWPRGAAQTTAWSIHVVLGLTLAGILATRIIWRIGSGRALPAADDGLLHVLARITHVGLYGLLIVVVALGIADALVRGFVLFGVLPFPQVGDSAMRGIVNHWHGLAANTVLILAGLHAAAALFHHYVRKDQLLRRMWSGEI